MLRDENRLIKHEDGTLPNPPITMLEQCLRRLRSLVDAIYIVDNGSIDGSHEVYERFSDIIKYVRYHPRNIPFDDCRDRKILLEEVKKDSMDWVICIDGDEVYEDAMDDYVKTFCATHSPLDHYALKFHYINLWRGRMRYRIDKWNNSWYFRMFSVPDLEIIGTPLHNYNFEFVRVRTIIPKKIIESPMKCLHYGWADWTKRLEKEQRYIFGDMEISGISVEESRKKYYIGIDEDGLKVALADPKWCEEFRSMKIGY